MAADPHASNAPRGSVPPRLEWSVAFLFAAGAFALAACAAGGAGPGGEASPGADDLIAQFERVVFADEYDESRALDRVAKWAGPVRVAARGARAREFEAVLTAHLARLGALTGLPMALLDRPDGSENLAVHFAPWDEVEALARPWSPEPDWLRVIVDEAGCLFVFRPDEGGTIREAIVLVKAEERADRIAACLLEELTQALGLPNDSNRLRPSVFNDWDRLVELPLGDRILVRALYDSRLAPGTPRAEAMALVGPIIRDLVERVRRAGPGALDQR